VIILYIHGSYRAGGNAVYMGEAEGRVSAIAAKRNTLPQKIPVNKI